MAKCAFNNGHHTTLVHHGWGMEDFRASWFWPPLDGWTNSRISPMTLEDASKHTYSQPLQFFSYHWKFQMGWPLRDPRVVPQEEIMIQCFVTNRTVSQLLYLKICCWKLLHPVPIHAIRTIDAHTHTHTNTQWIENILRTHTWWWLFTNL